MNPSVQSHIINISTSNPDVTNTNTNANPDIENQIRSPKLSIKTTNLEDINLPNPHGFKVQVKTSNDSATACCAVFCAFLVIIIFCLPLVICDLYFAYNDISCQHDSNPVGLTLSTWLQTSGFVVTGYLALFLIMLPFSLKNDCAKFLLKVCNYVFSGFILSWLIVGSIIFWKYLEPTGTCNKNISNYMWARLIIGLVGIYLNTRSGGEKKK